MPIDYSTNFSGRVNVVDFSVVLGTATLSTDFQKVTIPFTGSANPARTSSVDIETYQYSLDSGTTWYTMTLDSTTSDTSNLTFDVNGENYQLVWKAKTDIGTSVYNNNIKIQIKATATFGSDTITLTKLGYIYFARSVTNQAADADRSPFPEDYSGKQGNTLLENAPRQQS